MIRACAVVAVLAAAVPTRSEDGAWLRSLPGDGRSGCCYGLDVDPRGGAWFLGTLRDPGPIEIDGEPLAGAGASDALLLHVSPEGRIDRARAVGGPGPDDATELAVTADGAVYVVARFGASARVGDAFLPVTGDGESALLRFDPGGRCRWGTRLPGTGEDGPRALATSADGGVVVAGTFVRTWSRGDVPEIYVAGYDDAGARRWQRRCEGTGRSVAVDVDDGGNVYLGSASAAAEPGSGRMPADGWPLVQCIDARGGLRWKWEPGREADGGAARGRVVALVADPEGGCRVLGEVEGMVRIGDAVDPELRGRDLFLARLDADGRTRWITRFGGPGDDSAFDLARGADGACVCTGTFRATAFLEPWTLTSRAASAGFVAEWDANGACAWARVLEGPGEDAEEVLPYEVAAAPDGTTWVAGWFRAGLSVGRLETTGARDDVFLARILAGGSTR